MIKIKKQVKIIKQAGLRNKKVKPVKLNKPVKPVKLNKPVKPIKAVFPSFDEVKAYIPEIKKPDYDKIRLHNTPGFKVRILAGGAKRLLTAYYKGRFKPGVCNTLEIPEIRDSVNFSDRMILLSLGKIESITGCEVERVPGSSRKAIKIRIK